MKRIFTIFILLSLYGTISLGQVETYVGNILRVNMSSDEADYADTLGSWGDYVWPSSSTHSHYYKAISTKNNRYLLKYTSGSQEFGGEHPWIVYSRNYSLENIGTRESRIYVFSSGDIDYTAPYMLWETHAVKTPNGCWLFNGYFGNAFISNDDSLYIYSGFYEAADYPENELLWEVIGEIDGKSLGVFFRRDSALHKYYKFDLADSPLLDSVKFERIYTKDDVYLEKIVQIDSAVYLTGEYGKNILSIYKLDGDSLLFIKETQIPSNDYWGKTKWAYREGRLYFVLDGTLQTAEYSSSMQQFSEPRIMLYSFHEENAAADDNFNYAYVYEIIVNTYPFIEGVIKYDINGEVFTDTIVTNMNMGSGRPIIDSPYVYLHQVLYKIGINDDVNENANLTYKLSAYPNPFNPQTTIAFTIPNAGKVELAVYDMLGRKVTELLNEYRDKGSYEVKFNGANLASGIYFYTIKTGSFVKTNKLLLLK